MSKPVPTARLDRLLANMGYGSRRDIGLMTKAGWITLDGQAVQDEAARGIVYEIDGAGKVGAIHAGGPSIQYVEGCA